MTWWLEEVCGVGLRPAYSGMELAIFLSYHGLCSTTVDKCRVATGKLRSDVGT